MGLSASCICIHDELIVVIHTGGAYSLFLSKYLQVGAKVRMAMAGILIVGDVIAPSEHTYRRLYREQGPEV